MSIIQGIQKIQISNRMPDGTLLTGGQSRLTMPSGGYDVALDLVASILEDPTNSFMYPSNPPWTEPMKLVQALLGLYNMVGFDMIHL